MSILDGDNEPILISPAKIAAKRLVNQTRNTYEQMVQAFNQGSQIFWANNTGATPADIASELGANAREVFELHYQLGQFISSIKPEAIIEGSSLVGNFTMNEDGTVTILNSPTSEETPK